MVENGLHPAMVRNRDTFSAGLPDLPWYHIDKNASFVTGKRLAKVNDISVVVEDAELAHTPGLVAQGAFGVDTVQPLTFGIEVTDLLDPHIATRIPGDIGVVTFPKVYLHCVPAEDQVPGPAGIACKAKTLIEIDGRVRLKVCKDGDGFAECHGLPSIGSVHGGRSIQKKGSAVETADRRRLLAI